MITIRWILVSGVFWCASFWADEPAGQRLIAGKFSWSASAPLIGPATNADHSSSIKDPSVVFSGGRWHVFTTIRPTTPATMEYLNFADWKSADAAPRHVIAIDATYHCAPQIFFFTPQRRWYLIYQWADKTPGTGFFGPAFSTMDDVSKPETLTKPAMLFLAKPENVNRWIDFWVICDSAYAYLFFTGDDGRFWRSRTAIAAFPKGWSKPEIVLELPQNEFFEATCTYRLKGQDRFLTIAEAIGPGSKRYYKAYVADRLGGEWQPIADSWAKPFASINNIKFADGVAPWTDSISHGELLRDGCDETLTVDPAHLHFLFQGCSAGDRAGRNYGQYPWRLGLLELTN